MSASLGGLAAMRPCGPNIIWAVAHLSIAHDSILWFFILDLTLISESEACPALLSNLSLASRISKDLLLSSSTT